MSLGFRVSGLGLAVHGVWIRRISGVLSTGTWVMTGCCSDCNCRFFSTVLHCYVFGLTFRPTRVQVRSFPQMSLT